MIRVICGSIWTVPQPRVARFFSGCVYAAIGMIIIDGMEARKCFEKIG